jgi:hypothetical protein
MEPYIEKGVSLPWEEKVLSAKYWRNSFLKSDCGLY